MDAVLTKTKNKFCKKCGIEKPLTEFYKSPGTKDRLKNECKNCCKKYNEEHYRKNSEFRCQQTKIYGQTEIGKKVRAEIDKKQRQEHSEKLATRNSTWHAIESGKLSRPNHCSRCGGEGEIQAHHADYTLPLEVQWLCRTCHRLEHIKKGGNN
jgi:ribosomal protein S27AE